MEENYRFSRRGFLGAGAGAAAAAALGGSRALAATPGGGGPGSPGSGRDLALVNGRIHTLDEGNAVVSAVRISDGRFVSVGGGAGGPGPAEVVNLRGRTVIPGLIDNHCHFIRIGNAVGHDTRQLEAAFSVAEAQQAVAARAAGVPDGEFITALAGIARRQFAENRFPNLAELDDAAPNHPVVISELGVGQTNTLGRDRLRALGVAVSDDGVVANQNSAYGALAADITHEHRKRQLLDVSAYALSIGLTTVMDDHGSTGGAGFLDRVTGHDAILDLWREGALTVRVRARFPEQNSVAALQAILDQRWREFGDEMLQISGIGEWAPRGANYQASLTAIAERGWLYHQHLISTNEIQNHLDNFEQMAAKGWDLGALHWNLGHVGNITPEQVLQANNLGVGLAPHPWRYLTANVGEPRFRMILDLAEVPVGTGLDGARVAPLNPWAGVYFMTTGRNSGGALVNDGEQITREEAIRLYAGPQQGWFCKEEGLLGGITVGRYADLAVLSADVFDTAAVPDDELRRTTSVLTVVNGEIVHDAGVL